jgi:hypothetical protein
MSDSTNTIANAQVEGLKSHQSMEVGLMKNKNEIICLLFLFQFIL